MSSDTSDSNNSSDRKNVQDKQKINFTTDYMVNYLQDSPKLVPEDERQYYHKSEDNYSASSNDISSYLKKDNDTKKYSDSNTHTPNHSGTNGGINGGGSPQSGNIFQRSVQGQQNYRFDGNQSQPENPKKDIPEDYDNYNELSDEGKMLKRLDMLRKLGELAQYKVKLSQNYNMNSDYFTMKYEYQLHTNIRSKQNFVNWTSSLMLNCIYGVEILNDKYNPFELKLTGWSEQINADITNYYDVFGEIYEKYNKPGKSMSPELKLILMLGGSALKFHLNNVAMSGRLGGPTMQQIGGMNGPMGSQTNIPGQDPRVLEQMRQQAMVDRIKEETKKQAEALHKKSEEQHEQANKQMQDMLLLQQKQNEFAQQENLRKQKLEEFERVKAMMEQTKAQAQAQQPRPTVLPNPYSSMNNMQQFNGPQVSALANQRREEIDRQLQNMKNNLSTLNQQGVRQAQPQDIRDLNAEKLYARNPTQKNSNIKNRNSGITVDTSSESSSKRSETESSTISKASSSSSSTSSSSSSAESNAKSKSQGSSKKNLVDRSMSSRNNQSSMSKRKYKKTLTFDTA